MCRTTVLHAVPPEGEPRAGCAAQRRSLLTPTPAQYFIRLNSQHKKDKRRASIHDITTVAPAGGETDWGSVPITGQHPAVAGAIMPMAAMPSVPIMRPPSHP